MKSKTILTILGAMILMVMACARAVTPSPPPATPPPSAVTPALPPLTPTPALPSILEFATHAIGTVFNAVGSGLAKVASERSPITVVVTPTSGPPAWIPSLNETGRPHIGIINAFDLWQAHSGKVSPRPLPPGSPEMKPPYRAHPNLRLLMMGTYLPVGILVRHDSPIKTLADLRGRRLTWDFPAFPANIYVGLAMLTTGGLTIRDVVPVSITEVASGVRALMEGRVDAAIAAIGMPIVSEADAAISVRFLPVGTDPERIKAAQAIMPSGTVKPLKPGPAGMREELPLWQYPITVVTSNHMPDHVAYTLVKTWWDFHMELWVIHRQLLGWAPELFVQKVATIPYHPGAIKFYKEKGIWTPEIDRMQERLLRGELSFLD